MRTSLVVNTGPLIALGLLDRLELLRLLATQVLVPTAVHEEVAAGGQGDVGLRAYRRATWLEIRSPERPLDPLLGAVLDPGEGSVIQLAVERQIRRVLIDERKGRRIAREIYGLEVLGTARVLVEARRAGRLPPPLSRSFESLRMAGYWIDSKIVEACLKEVGEL